MAFNNNAWITWISIFSILQPTYTYNKFNSILLTFRNLGDQKHFSFEKISMRKIWIEEIVALFAEKKRHKRTFLTFFARLVMVSIKKSFKTWGPFTLEELMMVGKLAKVHQVYMKKKEKGSQTLSCVHKYYRLGTYVWTSVGNNRLFHIIDYQ
jgi:hypothetical protein